MATPFCYKDAYLSFGGSDISAYITGCTPNFDIDKLDVTAMGDDVHHNIGGLWTQAIEVTVNQSFTAAELDAILWALAGAGSKPIIFKPNGSTTSTSNPKWTGNGQILSYTPISGSVGDKGSTTFTIEAADGTKWARATAD